MTNPDTAIWQVMLIVPNFKTRHQYVRPSANVTTTVKGCYVKICGPVVNSVSPKVSVTMSTSAYSTYLKLFTFRLLLGLSI